MTPICIIPARGGSKRIPNKNIREFAGRPMLHHAIDIAIAAGFDTIAVSTDSPEVAAVAMHYRYRAKEHRPGVRVMAVDRPAELANDTATTAQVMKHELKGCALDQVACCLYPCTPLTDPWHLATAVQLFDSYTEDGAKFVMPVAQLRPPMQRALRMDRGRVQPVWPQFENVRSQDLEERYRDAGQWYLGRVSSWADPHISIYRSAVGLVVPEWRAIDVDDEEDWMMVHAAYAAFGRAA